MNKIALGYACASLKLFNSGINAGIAMPIFTILSRNNSGSSTSDSVVNP